MTWALPPESLPRPAEDLLCGVETGAEVVYAECREAEEAADRRHDFSDHLCPYACADWVADDVCWHIDVEAAWSWHMGPDR